MLSKLRVTASDALEQCDLFCSPITLRYKSDNDFKTITGGVCSLFLICLFVTVFYNKFMQCINMQQITSSVAVAEERDASLYNATTSEFMFVVGLDSIDMNNGPKYFSIGMDRISIINKIKTVTHLKLTQCQRSDWERLGSDFASSFDNMNFQRMLCPQASDYFQLQGTYSSDVFRYFKLVLTKCSDSSCRTDAEVAEFIKKNDFFKLNFYYSTWLLNPEQFNAATLKLDDSNYLQFTPQLGVSTNMYFESFRIKTDYALTPIDDVREQLGMTPSTVEMRPFPPQNQLVKLYLRKARTFRTIERSFTKFDELLSYIGGLFGMILVVVAVPLRYYNVCCYELSLATGLFTMKKPIDKDDKDQQGVPSCMSPDTVVPQPAKPIEKVDSLKPKVRSFNFLIYLSYLPYFVLKKIGCSSLNIPYLHPYYESIEVLRTQIDISHILRKLIFLDRVSRTVLDQHQRDLLYVIEKEDIADIKHETDKARIHKDLKQAARESLALRDEQPMIVVTEPTSPFTVHSAAADARKLGPLVRKSSTITRHSQFRLAFKTVSNQADASEISKRILQRVDRSIVSALQTKEYEYEQEHSDIALKPVQHPSDGFPSLRGNRVSSRKSCMMDDDEKASQSVNDGQASDCQLHASLKEPSQPQMPITQSPVQIVDLDNLHEDAEPESNYRLYNLYAEL